MISAIQGTSRDREESFDESREMELLRFTTAKSIDDIKSTFIGRLLHDSKRSTKTGSLP